MSGYVDGMRKAADSTHAVDQAAEQAKSKVGEYRDALDELGKAGTIMGGLLAAGIGLAVAKSAEFDAAMSNVQAATHESADVMDTLRTAALDAGASTVFSATEAANAIEELAKAGVSTADILNGGLSGALDLAAAGQLGVAEAAGIAATSLKMFNLEGGDMSHVADLLAAGAGKAMGDVSDLSQALNQAGLVANQTGLSIEETTAGLAAFAEKGLLGSDAGTAFKAMLQRLNPQSAESEKLMTELGISAYDTQGNFIGLAKFAGNLQTALKDLTPEQRNSAMATIFGSDAVRAASVIYDQGEQGIREWTKAVDDQGFAAETARIRLDNLKGDVEALGGAFETALIDTGSQANDTLRTMVQALTGLIDMYNDMPDPVKAVTLAVGGSTAALGLGVGAMSKAVPAWDRLKTAVAGAGWSMKGIVGAGAAAGLALGGLMLIVGKLASDQQAAKQQAQSYADTLDDVTFQVTESTRKMIAEQLNARAQLLWWEVGPSMAEDAKALGIGLDDLTDAIMGNADALELVNSKLEKTRQGFTGDDYGPDADAARRLQDNLKDQMTLIDKGSELKRNVAEASRQEAPAARDAAEAYQQQADSVGSLNTQLKELIDRINGQNDVAGKAITSNAAYQSALAGLKDMVKQSGASLDENTAAGSANAAALADLASKARTAAEDQFQLDQATMTAKDAADKYRDTLAAQREAFMKSATAAGFNADEVKALADRIFQMPTEKEFKALVDTTEAQKALTWFINSNNGRVIRVKVAADGGSFNYGGRQVAPMLEVPGQASGGPVLGRGPKGVDSELRMLAPGEHVLTAAEVDAAGGHGAVASWRESLIVGSAPRSGYGLVQGGQQMGTPGRSSSTPSEVRVILQSKGGVDLLQYIDAKVEQGAQSAKASIYRTIGGIN
ncbi:MAG: phage tail tape measure protein [Microbacterium sp.]